VHEIHLLLTATLREEQDGLAVFLRKFEAAFGLLVNLEV
jgi:hypothetical protein